MKLYFKLAIFILLNTLIFAQNRGPQTEDDARKLVRPHVIPRNCFIWHVNNIVGWAPIGATTKGDRGDTGCAHWVAHQVGITRGTVRCQCGYSVRVSDVVSGKSEYQLEETQVGDLWKPYSTHVGIVRQIEKDSETKKVIRALVEHDRSNNERGVVKEWVSSGTFYR